MKTAASINFPAVLAFSVHEMKNSLSIINELIRNFSKQEQFTTNKQLVQLEFEANRMNNNLMQLLILYKIEESKFSPVIDECLVADILNEVAAQQASIFQLNGLELVVKCDENLVCYCDNNLIANAIITVVNNSQRYARSKVILSAVQTEDGFTRFCVEDDGEGYPEHFLQPDAVDDTQVNLTTGNTGLGLFFVAKIAHMHVNGDMHGTIQLSNESCLGGAKFSLLLP